MAIENTVSNNFLSTFVDSINVFDCRLSGVVWLVIRYFNGHPGILSSSTF